MGRHLTTLRNFYGFLLREGKVETDPTEHLRTPRQWQTIPKYLNLEEIDRIIQAPDVAKPLGLRDRAMMELLYASGLRVSELCKLGIGDLDLDYQVLRTTGKGNKQRLVPVGKAAILAVRAYLETRTAGAAQRAGQPLPLYHCPRRLPDPAGILETAGRLRPEGRYLPRVDAPRAASQLRHPPTGGRSRSAQRAGHAGARRYLDHADLYPCPAFETSGDRGEASPPGVIRFRRPGNRKCLSSDRKRNAMSDYIYMLESHLSPDQNRAVEDVQAAAGMANVNVFLTGGAMRDMIAGFRIRDLDFVVEGNALKVAKAICDKTGATILSTDDNRKTAEIVFPSGVTAQIGMSRQEKYARVGSQAAGHAGHHPGRSAWARFHLQRDRAFAESRIARTAAGPDERAGGYRAQGTARGHHLRVLRRPDAPAAAGAVQGAPRFHDRRTNPDAGGQRAGSGSGEAHSGQALGEELKRISAEDNPTDILKGLEEAGLLVLFSPALFAKLNMAGLAKLEKAYHVLPDDARWRAARFGTFLHCATEKMTPKEKQALIKATELSKSDVDLWQKTEAHAKKLEAALRSPKIRKPSHVLPHRGGGGARGRAVRAVSLGVEAGAGAPAQSLPEVPADGSGDHARRMGDHRRQAGHAEVHEGPRGLHQRAREPEAAQARGRSSAYRAAGSGARDLRARGRGR